MGRVEKGRELAQRRSRKHKLKQLREKFAKAKDETEKDAIKEKVRKISPFIVLEESA
ncbi:MAG: DUF6800 family protein [Planctomycetota bacterium]|jgi:hypothetical protein|uniref:DUF6800 family protein n=1 Tax=uncultured Gimesia sp. TaxID=1678688 RepID=UPI002607471A|nr:DUF6800 family protein [uncultured Gimesia sp.]